MRDIRIIFASPSIRASEPIETVPEKTFLSKCSLQISYHDQYGGIPGRLISAPNIYKANARMFPLCRKMKLPSLQAWLACSVVLLCICAIGHCSTSAEDSVSADGKDPNAKNDSVPAIFEIPTEFPVRERKTNKELAPKCGNFLRNVLIGRWVRKEAPRSARNPRRKEILVEMRRKEIELDRDMRSVWRDRGYPQNPWESTAKCGYYRLRKGNGKHPAIGTWCDPKGPRPCCNHLLYGECVPAYLGSCSCSNCADVRKMDHAELMEWMPYDFWCNWRQYSSSEACDVLENSPVRELYYVGDSFLQSMYLSLLMILTGKPITGSWKKEQLSLEERVRCSNYGLTYFKACRAMIESMDDMRYKTSLCGDGRNVTFKAEFKKYYNHKFKNEFLQFVSGVLGKNGTYIVVGIGYHVSMDKSKAINEFFHPAVKKVLSYYRKTPNIPPNQRWPQFLYSLPMDYGILKPTRHLKRNYITKQRIFELAIRRYCRRFNIPVLDFTPLTKGVYSFDGTHYGVGVNNVKNQIFLNYLATLPSV